MRPCVPSHGSVEIREVRPDEYDEAAAVTVAAWAAEYGEALGEYAEHLANVVGRTEDATVLVAVLDRRIVGTVTFVADAESRLAERQREDEASIRMLAVPPPHRRRGIARALTEACIERARSAGKRAVVLHADAAIQPSRRLYEGLGFQRDPERDFAPDPDTQLVAYMLELSPADCQERA
jgi:ribosomal protein S18 acetylase RimI-like enzyme